MRIEILDSRPLLVVHASVVAKWFAPEIDDHLALRLRDRYHHHEVGLVGPGHLVPEVGNALWKKARRGELTPHAAERCFEQLLIDGPALIDSTEAMRSAFQLALQHRHPLYDCLYLALAQELRCDLITADEVFYGRMRPIYSFIRLLRDFA